MLKTRLRKQIAQELKALSSAEKQQMSAEACQTICQHEQIAKAHTIVAFWPLPDEVDVRPAIRQLHAAGKRVLLPHVVSDTEMELCLYDGDATLKEGAFGILEPTLRVSDILEESAVVLVPGRAFDACGNRLGRGKGYYDRFLSRNADVHTIGVCYKTQVVNSVPNDKYDIQVKEILWKISR